MPPARDEIVDFSSGLLCAWRDHGLRLRPVHLGAACPTSSCSTPPIRRSSAWRCPSCRREIAEASPTSRLALEVRARRSSAAGYHQQVPIRPGFLNLFLEQDGERRALRLEGGQLGDPWPLAADLPLEDGSRAARVPSRALEPRSPPPPPRPGLPSPHGRLRRRPGGDRVQRADHPVLRPLRDPPSGDRSRAPASPSSRPPRRGPSRPRPSPSPTSPTTSTPSSRDGPARAVPRSRRPSRRPGRR